MSNNAADSNEVRGPRIDIDDIIRDINTEATAGFASPPLVTSTVTPADETPEPEHDPRPAPYNVERLAERLARSGDKHYTYEIVARQELLEASVRCVNCRSYCAYQPHPGRVAVVVCSCGQFHLVAPTRMSVTIFRRFIDSFKNRFATYTTGEIAYIRTFNSDRMPTLRNPN